MDATASSSRREREGIISCLWQHSAIAFRLRRFLSACATACFHLGGPGELVGVTLRKKEIRAAESRPGCAGIETACPRLRRPAAQWGPGLAARPALRVFRSVQPVARTVAEPMLGNLLKNHRFFPRITKLGSGKAHERDRHRPLFTLIVVK